MTNHKHEGNIEKKRQKLLNATDSEQILRQVSAIVDSSVHGDESLHRGLVLHIWVVEAGVQHDDGEGQDVTGICGTNTRTQKQEWQFPQRRESVCHCWMRVFKYGCKLAATTGCTYGTIVQLRGRSGASLAAEWVEAKGCVWVARCTCIPCACVC